MLAAALTEPLSLTIGNLGLYRLPAGYYAYCGSAHGPGGLQARIRRHLNLNAPVFWHIDYIKRQVSLEAVYWLESNSRMECCLAQVLAAFPAAIIPVPAFCSSDCRSGCLAHLVYFREKKIMQTVLREFSANGQTLDCINLAV